MRFGSSRRLVRAASIVFVTFAAACQCGPAGPASLSPAAYCERLETAVCEDQQQCRSISAHVVCRPAWNASGRERYGGCPPDLDASLDAGRARFDGALAARCFGASAQQCRVSYPAECSSVVEGLVPMGGLCSGTADCVDGLECGGSTCPGTCAPPPCAAGQAPAADGGCEVLPSAPPLDGQPLSATCSPASACASGLRCEAGVCVHDRSAEGEACDAQRQCQRGLFCLSGTCGRGLALGTSCINTVVPCEVDLRCGSNGTCQPAWREGDACQGLCGLSDLRCDEGVCRRPLPEGAACSRSSQCRGTCEAGRCSVACR